MADDSVYMTDDPIGGCKALMVALALTAIIVGCILSLVVASAIAISK